MLRWRVSGIFKKPSQTSKIARDPSLWTRLRQNNQKHPPKSGGSSWTATTGSSEDGDDTNSVQDDEDASVDAPEPEVVPEETNFDILDDKENSASPSTDDTSEQKPEVCTEQKPLNASAAVDTSVPSEDNLVEHIGNVLGSLKAAREAQKAAEHERDETKGSLEAAVSQQSAAIRERDDARRGRDERDKTISELQTSLKFAEDENARVAAALRLSDQANLMRAEKRSKLKEALLALAQSL
ncbi:hypothetical protein PLICRDRAFT_381731 [Plicaturopsis crispa FD-325 SS-3]|nr:hypothetical protein PLICRDRAFT_381731 [Plicaturopsis crispa FD-325 SS-3]